MTRYTNRYRIPFPEDTDPIYQGAQAVANMAAIVDETLGMVSDASALDATSTATANRIVKRDASGRAQFTAPSATSDAATKGYVDTTKLGGLTFKRSTTPPPAGTSTNTITFVTG